MTRGRDESIRFEGGHCPEYHTVVLETLDEQQVQRNLSDQTSQSAEHVVVNYLPVDPESIYREPAITKGAMSSSGVGSAKGRITGVVNYHKESLERIRDRATAKEPVEKKNQ